MNDFTLIGTAPSDLAIGGNVSLSISFNSTSTTQGSHLGQLVFNPTSVNGSGTTDMAPITLELQAMAVPEPSTWAMFVGGLGMLAFGQRQLRRCRK